MKSPLLYQDPASPSQCDIVFDDDEPGDVINSVVIPTEPVQSLANLTRPQMDLTEELKEENDRMAKEIEVLQLWIEELKTEIQETQYAAASNLSVMKSIYEQSEK